MKKDNLENLLRLVVLRLNIINVGFFVDGRVIGLK